MYNSINQKYTIRPSSISYYKVRSCTTLHRVVDDFVTYYANIKDVVIHNGIRPPLKKKVTYCTRKKSHPYEGMRRLNRTYSFSTGVKA